MKPYHDGPWAMHIPCWMAIPFFWEMSEMLKLKPSQLVSGLLLALEDRNAGPRT